MIRLELQPEIEAQLAAEAGARGLALDRYIEDIIASRPAAVAKGGAAYSLDEADLERNLRQGLDDIAAGRTKPAEEVFAELHERYGIHG